MLTPVRQYVFHTAAWNLNRPHSLELSPPSGTPGPVPKRIRSPERPMPAAEMAVAMAASAGVAEEHFLQRLYLFTHVFGREGRGKGLDDGPFTSFAHTQTFVVQTCL